MTATVPKHNVILGRNNPQNSRCSASPSYLFEAAHEVVANWRSRQVCSAGTTTHVEKIIGTQHGVVFLGVTSSGEDAIHRDSHLLEGNT